MKFSENWLRSLVNPPVDRDELCRRLTMAGLEVEAVDALGGGLDGVVVGEIVECTPHANADKLRVCQVSVGQRCAAADRLRRAECTRRAEGAAGHDRRETAERCRNQAGGTAGSRVERHAVFGQGACARCRCLGSARIAGRRAGRQGAGRISGAARCAHRIETHAEPARLPGLARTRARRCRVVRHGGERTVNDAGRRSIRHEARSDARCRRGLPALRRPRRRRRERRGEVAAVAGRAPAPQRHPPDQRDRRCHAIRDAGTRSAHACLRHGQARRRDPRASCARGRKGEVARRQRACACAGISRHR